MLTRSNRVLATASVLTFALSACGGGGGGVASMPPPAPTPTPFPTPTPTPTPGATVLPPAHLGLVSSGSFAALGVTDGYTTNSLDGDRQPRSDPTNADVKFSYDPGSNTYQITLPGFQTGTLANTAYNGSVGEIATSTTSQVTAGSSTTLQPLFVAMPVPGSNHSQYTYTSFGEWDGKTGETTNGRTIWAEGIFAYGIPTAAGDVPTTGSASYTADIRARLDSLGDFPFVTGSATLLFDFAGGKLSGSMNPKIVDSFDGIFIDFGQFDFKQTVYSIGSATFSGKFIVPGLPNADSSFNGNFTGPDAAELMARFITPVQRGDVQQTISGVWIGKKD